MRVLVAPCELKGTLSASQAALAIARGIREAAPGTDVDLAPLADGGPGTVEAFLRSTQATAFERWVRGPLGARVRASSALTSDRGAVVEMAMAAGLHLLEANAFRPLSASTYGVGELLRAVLDTGVTSLILGVGGSATTDGGTGMLAALGVRFLDRHGKELPPGGGALQRLQRIDVSGLNWSPAHVTLRVATDVRSPLLGASGAARVFAPQKGASPRDVEVLEQGLAQLVHVCESQLGIHVAELPGTGAAGGLGYGAAAFLSATLEPGFELVAQWLQLRRRVSASDWILTSEGSLDAQSSAGKAPFRLAELCRAQGRRVVALVGRVGEDVSTHTLPFDEVHAALEPQAPMPSGPEEAANQLRALAREWARTHL